MTLYYTPPGYSSIQLLADYIAQETKNAPLSMAKAVIFLPNRRSCRFLQAALLEKTPSAAAILLPRILSIPDLNIDTPIQGLLPNFLATHPWKPALSKTRREFLLARLIQQGGFTAVGSHNVRHSLRLARSLVGFLEETINFQTNLTELENIVDSDYAEHWQKTLVFLNIIRQAWPQILADEGAINPEELHQQALASLCHLWRAVPPADPVIAVGITHTDPLILQLLSVIARLPKGVILFPAIDLLASPGLPQEIRQDPTHPQYKILKIMAYLKQDIALMQPWPSAPPIPHAEGRHQLLHLAMRPSALIGDWYHETNYIPATSLENIQLIECPGLREESQVVALILRAALENPDHHRIALITPDRRLALQVAIELKRWHIDIDDSAGQFLHQTVIGKYLRLTAQMFNPNQKTASFLAALKHPFSHAGRNRHMFLTIIRQIEIKFLRQNFPANLAMLLERCREKKEYRRLLPLLTLLHQQSAAFAELFKEPLVSFKKLVKIHCAFAEWLASTPEQAGTSLLWKNEEGETAAQVIADILEADQNDLLIAPEQYADILTDFLQEKTIYPKIGFNPRLFLWGVLEAQLQQADVVVLAGLNEEKWPPTIPSNPWLNSRFRQQLGLPPSEEMIGASAFDFIQNCYARKVYLTRSIKMDGTPTRPSRFIQRLQALAKTRFGMDIPKGDWLNWQHQLIEPVTAVKIPRPHPCPVLEQRPLKIAATDMEILLRNPYEFYTKRILGLKPLLGLRMDPQARTRGILIHHILYEFNRLYPQQLPKAAEKRFYELAQDSFAPYLKNPQIWAFWWLPFQPVLAWLWQTEYENRPTIKQVFGESEGSIILSLGNQSLTLHARADRIDWLNNDQLRIIDYKTGKIPSKTQIIEGDACQLPIELLIAEAGAFKSIPSKKVQELTFYQLGSQFKNDPMMSLNPHALQIRENLTAKLHQTLNYYYNVPTSTYEFPVNQVDSALLLPYQHLARFDSWNAGSQELGADSDE